ncbi:hypothetical protein [Lysobacter fragariae]
MSARAYAAEFADYDGSAHKLLSDNRVAYVAMSILTGLEMRDGSTAPILPHDQAEDVYRWAYGDVQ